jgi:hypothetical protein
MRVIFQCGCEMEFSAEKTGGIAPECPIHHRRVARVRDVPPPRVTGVATGPLVKTVILEPKAVSFTKAGDDATDRTRI